MNDNIYSPEITLKLKSLLKEKISQDNDRQIYNDRLIRIMEKLDTSISKSCNNELKELDKYASYNKNDDGIFNFNIKEGKETEANKALSDFAKCTKNYNDQMQTIKSFEHIIEYILNNQITLCLNDCKNMEDECIKECLDFSYNYTFKGIRSLAFNNIQNIEYELNRYI
jgi:hypothetical protein